MFVCTGRIVEVHGLICHSEYFTAFAAAVYSGHGSATAGTGWEPVVVLCVCAKLSHDACGEIDQICSWVWHCILQQFGCAMCLHVCVCVCVCVWLQWGWVGCALLRHVSERCNEPHDE